MSTNQIEKAVEIYDNILSHYTRSALAAKKELFHVSGGISFGKNSRLSVNLAFDIFRYKVKRLLNLSQKKFRNEDLYC